MYNYKEQRFPIKKRMKKELTKAVKIHLILRGYIYNVMGWLEETDAEWVYLLFGNRWVVGQDFLMHAFG